MCMIKNLKNKKYYWYKKYENQVFSCNINLVAIMIAKIVNIKITIFWGVYILDLNCYLHPKHCLWIGMLIILSTQGCIRLVRCY